MVPNDPLGETLEAQILIKKKKERIRRCPQIFLHYNHQRVMGIYPCTMRHNKEDVYNNILLKHVPSNISDIYEEAFGIGLVREINMYLIIIANEINHSNRCLYCACLRHELDVG